MLHACDQRFDVTRNLENFCELNKAQNKARSRLTKNVWPYPLSSWGEKITSQTKGKDQTKGRRSRSSKALVCLFVFSADADSHALASRTLHWQMSARVWKVDRGIFLAIGRTSDSQTQPPHVLVEQRKKKGGGLQQSGNLEMDRNVCPRLCHMLAMVRPSLFAPLPGPTDCTAPLHFFWIYKQLIKLCRSFTDMYSFSSESEVILIFSKYILVVIMSYTRGKKKLCTTKS